MLRYASRRLLWVVPSVLGVSIVAFFVLSLVPVPPDLGREERRARFLDLPLFFNTSSEDVRTRVLDVLDRLETSEPESSAMRAAQAELVRIGGAGFPVLLPRLDGLPPATRVRVARALAPIAVRMGLEHRGEIYDPERVVLFWNRFWDVRGVELTEQAARTAVERYARYGTEARAQQVRVLDTYALPVLMETLEVPETVAELDRARRLVAVIAHVTEQPWEIGPHDSLEEARATVWRWRRWWLSHETDYRRLVGAERVAAFVLQTRYGKWVYETIVLGLGEDARGRPLFDQLVARLRVTGSLLACGVTLAYLLALALGALSGLRRGQPLDWAVTAIVLVPYALTPTVLAVLVVRWIDSPVIPFASAVALLAAVLLADPTRQQREALLPALASDYVRAAVARGAGPWRVTVVHALRNALSPVVTRGSIELPMAVTACFVMERAFALPGLGEATIAAVGRRDTSWLMAMAVSGALFAVVSLVASDVAKGLIDPRIRSALFEERGRRG